MTETRGENRAETDRRNDDSDLIDDAEDQSLEGAGQQGSKGGILQRDLGTRAEGARATDPAAHESVKKGDHIARGDGESPPDPPTEVVTERR